MKNIKMVVWRDNRSESFEDKSHPATRIVKENKNGKNEYTIKSWRAAEYYKYESLYIFTEEEIVKLLGKLEKNMLYLLLNKNTCTIVHSKCWIREDIKHFRMRTVSGLSIHTDRSQYAWEPGLKIRISDSNRYGYNRHLSYPYSELSTFYYKLLELYNM